MKKIICILLILLLVSMPIIADMVNVEGQALIEKIEKNDNENIKILFFKAKNDVLVDSTFTHTNGNYKIQLPANIYDIKFSKNSFYAELNNICIRKYLFHEKFAIETIYLNKQMPPKRDYEFEVLIYLILLVLCCKVLEII